MACYVPIPQQSPTVDPPTIDPPPPPTMEELAPPNKPVFFDGKLVRLFLQHSLPFIILCAVNLYWIFWGSAPPKTTVGATLWWFMPCAVPNIVAVAFNAMDTFEPDKTNEQWKDYRSVTCLLVRGVCNLSTVLVTGALCTWNLVGVPIWRSVKPYDNTSSLFHNYRSSMAAYIVAGLLTYCAAVLYLHILVVGVFESIFDIKLQFLESQWRLMKDKWHGTTEESLPLTERTTEESLSLSEVTSEEILPLTEVTSEESLPLVERLD